MANVAVGLCILDLHLPGLTSLKDKRGTLKPMLSRLRKTFNVSAAEVGHQDVWQSSRIAVATVSNSHSYNEQVLQKIVDWLETHYPDAVIVEQEIEML